MCLPLTELVACIVTSSGIAVLKNNQGEVVSNITWADLKPGEVVHALDNGTTVEIDEADSLLGVLKSSGSFNFLLEVLQVCDVASYEENSKFERCP